MTNKTTKNVHFCISTNVSVTNQLPSSGYSDFNQSDFCSKFRKAATSTVLPGIAYLMLLFLTGCQGCFLNLTQLKVDCDYLASSHVGTPDPRRQCPPYGEKILIEWKVPKEILSCDPFVELHVIYWDYTEGTFIYPIRQMVGYTCYSLLGCDFEEKKGILTFRADLRLEDQTIYKSWKHQMWVNLITVEEEQNNYTPADEEESSQTISPSG